MRVRRMNSKTRTGYNTLKQAHTPIDPVTESLILNVAEDFTLMNERIQAVESKVENLTDTVESNHQETNDKIDKILKLLEKPSNPLWKLLGVVFLNKWFYIFLAFIFVVTITVLNGEKVTDLVNIEAKTSNY